MGNDARSPRKRLRFTVGSQLLLALVGMVSFSTAVALFLQDRALARDLEQAAALRLERSARAARNLLDGHVASLSDRYRAISGTPQLRASLEVGHAPTLTFYARQLREREGAEALVFVDEEDRVIAAVGDPSLVEMAVSALESGLGSRQRRPFFVILAELTTAMEPLGRLVAVHPVESGRLADWSELSGASLSFEAPGASAALSRTVASLPDLRLQVAANLEAERAALAHSRANLLLGGAVSLALSLLASGLVARRLVQPVREIQHAAERIADGDFETRIASRRRDEVGEVARAFDAMLDHLRTSRAQVAAHLEELTRSRTHLDNAQRRARIGSFEIDLATGAIEASSQLLELYQIEDEGKPLDSERLLSRVHPEDRHAIDSSVRLAVEEGRPITSDFRLHLPDGSERIMHSEAHPVHDAQGRIVRVDGTAQDVTERRRVEEQIRFLAYHDGLTGLGNRRLFSERLQRALDRAQRADQQLGVLFLDLDHFKRINDTLGHSLGDELLRGVAERLVTCLRLGDAVSRPGGELGSAVSRIGGDEFTILIEQLDNPQSLSLIAERLMEALRRPFLLGEHEVVVGASIGIATCPLDGQNVEELLRNADSAMYHAKEHGRNQYQFYAESMNAAALRRLEMEQRIRNGLLAGELEVHYQPKCNLVSHRVTGLEALVRWRDPEKGLVLPGEFIPIAEQTGMIIEIDRCVLQEVCRQLAEWERADPAEMGFQRVSVNVSARQFASGELVRTVREVLEATGARADRLELELTESTVMHDEQSVIATLEELRGIGVAVSLDDFGTGYSSLSYLRTLPVDTLKIDMSFVRNIASNPEDAALTAAIVSMGKARGLRVVAEGVETREQRRLLDSFGCDEIQGFLISAAVPATEVDEMRRKLYRD